MKIKNIGIRLQLMIGFSAILFFVVVVGVVAYVQKDKLHKQTEKMYEHPYQVRRAIGDLNSDILTSLVGMRDLLLANNDKEKQAAIQIMEVSAINAEKQFSIIKERYLGPPKDVEEAYQAYIIWKIAREENIKPALSGEIEKVRENLLTEGSLGSYSIRN